MQDAVKPAPPDESLWDPRDVAAYLKVSRSWVYRAAERGELPCLRIGALVRFEPVAVRAWARGERGGAVVLPIAGRGGGP